MSGARYTINGIEGLEKAITETYSGAKSRKIKKEALNTGGDVVVEQLKKNFEFFKHTGYSQEEIVRSDARSRNNIESLKIGWYGEHNRWRIVHLNEFGYNKKGKQYTPAGFGVIEKTIQETMGGVQDVVAGRLKQSL